VPTLNQHHSRYKFTSYRCDSFRSLGTRLSILAHSCPCKCNMSDFDALLADYTTKGNAKVHGVIIKCVDRNGIPPSPLFFFLWIDTDTEARQGMKYTAKSRATTHSPPMPRPSTKMSCSKSRAQRSSLLVLLCYNV
jgi:hypothetical protein